MIQQLYDLVLLIWLAIVVIAAPRISAAFAGKLVAWLIFAQFLIISAHIGASSGLISWLRHFFF